MGEPSGEADRMTPPQGLAVDEHVCASTGFCVRVAPEIFQLSGTTGKAVVKVQVTSAELEAQAEEAEIICPTGAISFASGGSC
jgi:ferredoxin